MELSSDICISHRSDMELAVEAVLSHLESNDAISNSVLFAREYGFSHRMIVKAITQLKRLRYIEAEEICTQRLVLTGQGEIYAARGTPEAQVFQAVPPEGITHEELQNKLNQRVYLIGRLHALENKWIEIGKLQVVRKVQQVEDTVREMLIKVQNGEAVSNSDVKAMDLWQRNLTTTQKSRFYVATKGPNYAPSMFLPSMPQALAQ